MSKNEIENSRASGKNSDLLAAVAALQHGDVVVFPTETLYGLGADALNPVAVEKIFQLKGRDPNNPFPVLVGDFAMLDRLVSNIPALARRLMESFWPGPLTIILPARNDIPRPLVNRSGGIGLRISSAPIATEVVKLLGRPVTATSANPSGREPARTVAEAQNYFSAVIDQFVDGGTLSSRHGSTVIDVGADHIKIIRAGEITGAQIEAASGAKVIA